MKVQEYLFKALQDAVQMELEGREFYLQAAKKVKDPGVKEILEYLAETEKYHVDKLKEVFQSIQKDPTWTKEMAAFTPPKHEPFFCVAAMAKSPGTGGKDDLEALTTGIKMEECSIDYYSKLAREATNPLAKRFFMSVAHEERGHYNALVDMHNYLTDPVGWYFVHEKRDVDAGM